MGSNRCPPSSRRRLGRGSLSALSSCLWSHQGVRRHSRPKGHSTPKRPVTGLGNLSTTPTAAPRARGVRQLYSQQPLAKTMYVSLGPADADRQPCGGTTQDLQFVNRFDPTAAGRLCNCALLRAARSQHLSTNDNSNATVRRGYQWPPLREAPRLSDDPFIGRRPANSEPICQADLHNITRCLRMRRMFPASQPREGLVPGKVTAPAIVIGMEVVALATQAKTVAGFCLYSSYVQFCCFLCV